jgi:hypothetical protein
VTNKIVHLGACCAWYSHSNEPDCVFKQQVELAGIVWGSQKTATARNYTTQCSFRYSSILPQVPPDKYTNVLKAVTNQNIMCQIGVDDKPNPFDSPINSAEARAE